MMDPLVAQEVAYAHEVLDGMGVPRRKLAAPCSEHGGERHEYTLSLGGRITELKNRLLAAPTPQAGAAGE